jgi:hypothetical protein
LARHAHESPKGREGIAAEGPTRSGRSTPRSGCGSRAVRASASSRSLTRQVAPRSARGLSPLGRWEAVPVQASQAFLRQLFERWGLPERVRLDNGHPWGSSTDLPPALALWLLGLGIGLIYNPPRTPQRNGVVERLHGLVEPWAEPERCQGLEEYQAHLDWTIRVQRELYPAVPPATENESGSGKAKRSRLAAYPELARTIRPYEPTREGEGWQIDRVRDYLAQGCWRRRVDKVGRISIYRRALGVGRVYRYRDVLVSFDPLTDEWVVQKADGNELARHQASEITAERISRLEVSNRPTSHPPTPDTTSRQTT